MKVNYEDKVLVFSGRTDEETKELYDALFDACGCGLKHPGKPNTERGGRRAFMGEVGALFLRPGAVCRGRFCLCGKAGARACCGPGTPQGRPAEMLLAALAFLLFAAFVQGVVALCAVRQSPGAGLENALAQFFGGIDAPHYISLARYGYQNEWNETVAEQHLRIVFFPLFPWLLRALNAFGVLPWYVLGCAVQLPLFAGCGAALYALWRKVITRARACIWLLAFPGTFSLRCP